MIDGMIRELTFCAVDHEKKMTDILILRITLFLHLEKDQLSFA